MVVDMKENQSTIFLKGMARWYGQMVAGIKVNGLKARSMGTAWRCGQMELFVTKGFGRMASQSEIKVVNNFFLKTALVVLRDYFGTHERSAISLWCLLFPGFRMDGQLQPSTNFTHPYILLQSKHQNDSIYRTKTRTFWFKPALSSNKVTSL